MVKVEFIFNKEKDIYNIWETANAKSYGYDFSSKMPKPLVDFCKDKNFNECEKFIEKFFSNIYSSKLPEKIAESFNNSWKLIEEKYFSRMQKLTGKPFKLKKSTGFITIAPRCPYLLKENNFMINLFASIPQVMATTGHELMHLHFHEHYFNSVKKEIGEEKAHDIKEALTVLLNIEFQDLWFVPDSGYDSHKDLREFIKTEWKKDKDFNELIDKCIEFVKGKNARQ